MDRDEFLKKLKIELENHMSKAEMNSQLDYYDKYISDEMAKGRSEKDVLEELGDPRLIAKTIKTVNNKEDYVEPEISSENNNGRKAKKVGPIFYMGDSSSVLGCAIIFLVIFIIVIGIIRLFIGGMSLMFVYPGFILLVPLLILLFNRRR